MAALAIAVAALALIVHKDFFRGAGTLVPAKFLDKAEERIIGVRRPVPEDNAEYQRSGMTSRFALWRAAIRMWRSHPIVGVCPDNFRMLYYENLDYVNEDLESHKGLLRAHDLFLDVMSETGLLGLGALLAFLAAVTAATRKMLRKAVNIETLSLAAAFGVFLIGNLFDVIYYYYIFMIPVLALFAAIADKAARQPEVVER